MDMLCLYFPRLGVDLARRRRPQLAGRPVVLLSGAGDDAKVTAHSSEAGALGVLRGMTAGEARRAAPGAVFLADNPADRLAELDRVAAIAGAFGAALLTDHVETDRIYIPCQSAVAESERVLAQNLAGEILSSARIGAGSTHEAAFEAARASRRSIMPASSTPAVASAAVRRGPAALRGVRPA